MRGRLVSPRPCLASRAWALAMARSPPLTATYIGSVLLAGREAGGARQAGHGAGVHEEQVDTAREESRVAPPRAGELVGSPRGGECGNAVDAGTRGGEPGRARAAADV